MSENNYGYCNYCGKYRSLKWNGGYCSEKCYCESGQQEQDTIDEERYQLMWYYRDDVVAFIFRTIVMSIGWMIYYLIVAQVCIKFKLVGLTRFLAIFQFPSNVIIPVVLAIVQNIIVRGKGESFRKFIKYGIPIVLSIAIIIYTHLL